MSRRTAWPIGDTLGSALVALAIAGCGRSGLYDRRPPAAFVAPPACDGGLACDGGSLCPAPFVTCDGSCLDPTSTREHCGAGGDCRGAGAGAVCRAGEICARGTCRLSCPTYLVACDGVCTDPSSSPIHCGAAGDCLGAHAGVICATDGICAAGLCAAGLCASPNLRCAGGACVDPQADPANCGACGRACAAGEGCISGLCREARPCSAAELLDGAEISDNDTAGLAGLAGDAQGNTFVAWRQIESGTGVAEEIDYARRFDPRSATWGGAMRLGDRGDASFQPIHLAVSRGNAVAAWDGTGGATAAIFDAVSGSWGAARELSAFDVGGATFDGHGNAIVDGWDDSGAWTSSLASPGALFPRATYLPLPTIGAVVFSSAGPGDDGNLTMFLFNFESAIWVVRIVRFDAAGQISGEPAVIGQFPGTIGFFTVNADASGGAIATWKDQAADTGAAQLWAARYSAATASWQPSALVESDAQPIHGSQALRFGTDGSALLLWYRVSAAGALGLRAGALGAGATPWDAPVLVQDDVAFQSTDSYYGPAFAVDGRGNGASAAVSNDGGLWLTVFDASRRKWGGPRLVASVSSAQVESQLLPIQVSLADDGTAVVAWQATNHIWASYCR